MEKQKGPISQFMDENYFHFNSLALVNAAKAYNQLLAEGGKMFLAMGGAMSTARLGISLAEMIRQDKFAAVCCSANNLEEDIMNLVALKHYKDVPYYRDLTPDMEQELLDNHYNRVTDVCIPEEEAFRVLEREFVKIWHKATKEGTRKLPYEYMYELIRSGVLEQYYEADPKDSWVLEACKKDIPIFVPAWEDCTTGNIFTAHVIHGDVNVNIVKNGIETMIALVDWYKANVFGTRGCGFFQIGGGTSGDFPICAVPMMSQDLQWKDVPLWQYFCQISDSTTSYGSYSGAVPNEKITWGKLAADTPKFVIESDATIVAPLLFAYVCGK